MRAAAFKYIAAQLFPACLPQDTASCCTQSGHPFLFSKLTSAFLWSSPYACCSCCRGLGQLCCWLVAPLSSSSSSSFDSDATMESFGSRGSEGIDDTDQQQQQQRRSGARIRSDLEHSPPPQQRMSVITRRRSSRSSGEEGGGGNARLSLRPRSSSAAAAAAAGIGGGGGRTSAAAAAGGVPLLRMSQAAAAAAVPRSSAARVSSSRESLLQIPQRGSALVGRASARPSISSSNINNLRQQQQQDQDEAPLMFSSAVFQQQQGTAGGEDTFNAGSEFDLKISSPSTVNPSPSLAVWYAHESDHSDEQQQQQQQEKQVLLRQQRQSRASAHTSHAAGAPVGAARKSSMRPQLQQDDQWQQQQQWPQQEEQEQKQHPGDAFLQAPRHSHNSISLRRSNSNSRVGKGSTGPASSTRGIPGRAVSRSMATSTTGLPQIWQPVSTSQPQTRSQAVGEADDSGGHIRRHDSSSPIRRSVMDAAAAAAAAAADVDTYSYQQQQQEEEVWGSGAGDGGGSRHQSIAGRSSAAAAAEAAAEEQQDFLQSQIASQGRKSQRLSAAGAAMQQQWQEQQQQQQQQQQHEVFLDEPSSPVRPHRVSDNPLFDATGRASVSPVAAAAGPPSRPSHRISARQSAGGAAAIQHGQEAYNDAGAFAGSTGGPAQVLRVDSPMGQVDPPIRQVDSPLGQTWLPSGQEGLAAAAGDLMPLLPLPAQGLSDTLDYPEQQQRYSQAGAGDLRHSFPLKGTPSVAAAAAAAAAGQNPWVCLLYTSRRG